MSRNSKKTKPKHKAGSGAYNAVPRACLQSNSLAKLSPYAKALLLDLMAQYNGFNNGDLSVAWKLMEKRHWKSKETLSNAKKELLNNGWIIVTRQGGRNKCSLYALTLYNIDEDIKKKYDSCIKATNSPPGGWYRDNIVPIRYK